MQFISAQWTLLLCGIISLGFAQSPSPVVFNYRISGETGISSAHLSAVDSDLSPTFRLNARLSLTRKFRSASWQIEGQFRPEIFLSEDIPNQTRYRLFSAYQRSHGNWQWQLSAGFEGRQLSVNSLSLTTRKWNGDARIVRRLGRRMQLTVGGGADILYASDVLRYRLTAGQLYLLLQRQASASVRWQLGATFSPFSIKETAGNTANTGDRSGIVAAVTYQKSWICQLRYHGILHRSDLTLSPSTEHWLHLLAGKILPHNWSVFFLADYRFRDFEYVTGAPLNLLYSPYDDDRKAYLKLEKDFDKQRQLFFLFGYQSEDLLNFQSRYTGWRGLVGVEWRKP